MQCPTGALQFERRDGGPSEPVPEDNTVTVVPDGPLHLRGDIEITDPDGEMVLEDTRVALCRCGASQNKPLCDDSHVDVDFQADGSIADGRPQADDDPVDGVLRVRTRPDGPVTLEGEFEIRGTDPESTVRSSETALCRCGSSENKPFCDGTHAEVGFSSDD
jgi:CDGSH-type Zn-finger protein